MRVPPSQDVSGAARPYEMLALMGPSGAGKSTLLDILAARKSVGRLTGAVTVNGAPRGSSFVRSISYVPQEDNFLPSMTVIETCELHAALTLPRGTPRPQAASRIEEVLAAMGMLHARDTLVGGVLPGGLSLRGLSGGERRRVSVAIGILAAPSIVFLDEPTSGLDSCSALAVVEHLRDRARDSGLTVVASIHQPRAAVWSAFDACAVLSQGLGMYQGRCDAIVSWFEGGLGYGPWDSAVHGTASDWVMDLVNVGFSKAEVYGITGRTIVNHKDLQMAAQMFSKHYKRIQQQQQQRQEAAAAAAEKQRTQKPAAPPLGPALSQHQVQSAGNAWSMRPSLTSATLGKRSSAGGAVATGPGAREAAATVAVAGIVGARCSIGDAPPLIGGSLRSYWQRQQQDVIAAAPLPVPAKDGSSKEREGRPVIIVNTEAGDRGSNSSGSASVATAASGADDGGAGLGAAAMAAAMAKRRPTFWSQFRALFRRELLATMRNPADVAGRMLLFAWVGLFCGLVFWRLGDGFDAVRNRINLLFVECLQYMLLPYVYMSLYAADRRHFTADISARLYSPGPYYAAKTLAVLPFALANCLFSTFIIYGMAGLRLTPFAVAINGVTSAILYLVAQQVQALAAILMPNEDAAFLLTIAYTTVNIYMSNFVIRFRDMANGWLSFLRYTSAVNFAYASILRAEFDDRSLSCAGGIPPEMIASVQSLLPNAPMLRMPALLRMATSPGDGCRMRLDAVLEYFEVDLSSGAYIAALLLHLAAMHAATFGALLLLARKERR